MWLAWLQSRGYRAGPVVTLFTWTRNLPLPSCINEYHGNTAGK